MDTTILVDKQYEEGKKLIQKLDEKGTRYPIALWIDLPEKNGWTLLFGIPNLNKTGAKDIFKDIHSSIVTNNIELSLNDITLMDTSSEVCRAFRSVMKTGYNISKMSFAGNFVDGKRLPDAIIYRVN